jgi:ribosomal protein S18 acetylase RimI-like enzyme
MALQPAASGLQFCAASSSCFVGSTEETEVIVHVRDATLADADTIVRFNCGIALETENLRLAPSIVAAGVAEGLKRGGPCRYFIAEVESTELENQGASSSRRIAGQCMITTEWSDWRAGLFWWLQSVYVAPEFRGRGVFRAMHGHVESQARADPRVCGLRLYVESDNRQAREAYERLGLKPSGHVVYENLWSGPLSSHNP